MLESRDQRPAADGPSFFETHLDEIERVVSWVSRRACLGGDDAEEFRSWVHVRLLENDARVLRRHSGRGSLKTYLVAVVHNLARDYRYQRWGRWRPSAAAERRGVVAVQLETLIHRDGFSVGVATEMLQQHHGVRMSASEIADLAAELPPRATYTVEGGDRVEAAPGSDRTEDGLLRREAEARLDDVRRALQESLAELEVDDRLILRMHYESGLTVAAIASALGLRQRRLYTRRDRSLRTLRSALERRGLNPDEVLSALRWSGDERKHELKVFTAEGERLGPSNPSESLGQPSE